jgi:hypothetical protein
MVHVTLFVVLVAFAFSLRDFLNSVFVDIRLEDIFPFLRFHNV